MIRTRKKLAARERTCYAGTWSIQIRDAVKSIAEFPLQITVDFFLIWNAWGNFEVKTKKLQLNVKLAQKCIEGFSFVYVKIHNYLQVLSYVINCILLATIQVL